MGKEILSQPNGHWYCGLYAVMLRTSTSSSSVQNGRNSERTNSIRRLSARRNRLGRPYMAFIAAFRHWVVCRPRILITYVR